MSIEKPCEKASNSEKRRWLEQKSILLNGKRPGPDDVMEINIFELIFFPKSEKRKTTIV